MYGLVNVTSWAFTLIKLHPAVLPKDFLKPLLSPLGRSLILQVQLGPIEVLMEMSKTRWWFGINT